MVVEINNSHMESLLHHYGILTAEMVAVIRHVSETSWRICSIDWRVKQRQSATRRLWIGTAHFHGVFRALGIGFQRLSLSPGRIQ